MGFLLTTEMGLIAGKSGCGEDDRLYGNRAFENGLAKPINANHLEDLLSGIL